MGTHGIAPYIVSEKSSEQVTIIIRDVAKIMTQFLAVNSELDIILKCDCEGSEFEIFERLENENMIRRFKAIMVEWHLKGPFELISILKRNNFAVLSQDECSSDIGMVYALRNDS
jgi:hypothetical protein